MKNINDTELEKARIGLNKYFEDSKISNNEILEIIKNNLSTEFYRDVLSLIDNYCVGSGHEQLYSLVTIPTGKIKTISYTKIEKIYVDIDSSGCGYLYVEMTEDDLDNNWGYLKLPFYN